MIPALCLLAALAAAPQKVTSKKARAAVVEPAVEAPDAGTAPEAAVPPTEASAAVDGGTVEAVAPQTDVKKMDADACVAAALGSSGLVTEADGKVEEWRGRLAEVQSVYRPKLTGMAFVAPMFRVRGSPLDPDVERDYTEWGPYFHLEAVLAQPIYTFGRAEAGKRAAADRLRVEEARARQTRNVLALEVRKMYFTHLYAKSIRPALETGRKILDAALKSATESYEDKSGKVSQADLQKLVYGSAELDRYRVQAEIGEALSLAALKHMMGLPQDAAVDVADAALPEDFDTAVPEVAQLVQIAADLRPEWAQVKYGQQAARSFELAERRANMPTLFAAAQFGANYTAMRPDARNPYLVDPYNNINGGVAMGLQFDIDPWKAYAKGNSAAGLGTQVDGLAKFASTGIPMEIRKAHDDLSQAIQLFELATKSATAGRKWMTFAGAAYTSGTGEAKDVLEGVVAYLTARRTFFESLQNVHIARAQILYTTGRTGVESEKH